MTWLSQFAVNPFYEFAIILLLAAVLGGIGMLLKQPLIVTFIALGVLVGPSFLDIVQSKENIHLLAEIGISILLFIVGLKLDLRLIKATGKIALFTGLGQVIFTAVIGFLIAILLGFSQLHGFYIAVALTFSSTIIIVKLLSDKKEIDSLHGQIAIGFLIVQDIVVIIVMIVLSALGRNDESSLWTDLAITLLNGSILILAVYLLARWVIPSISYFLAKSQELLSLFAIALAITLASVSEIIGFSGEVGAFLAGVSLASSPFKESISSRLVSLRDFLLLFFFVNLGANLNLGAMGSQLYPVLIFSVFVLIGNPIIVLVIMGLMGYRKRTAFLAGLTVAQISEFSLIFAGMGLQMGHLNEDIVGLITLVGLITIGMSTYMILYSHPIYDKIFHLLSIFEKKDPYGEAKVKLEQMKSYDLIVFGLGRFGNYIAAQMSGHPNVSFMGVDFDPLVVKNWQDRGKTMVYGDIEDPDLLEHIPFAHAKCIIITIPDATLATQLIQRLKENNYKGTIYLIANTEKDMEQMQDCQADKILMPYHMAAENFYQSILLDTLQKADTDY